MATGMIPNNTIRNVHSRLTFVNVDVWICPRGTRVELRTMQKIARADGAVKVGTYNSAVSLAEFMEDVAFSYREFAGLGVVRAA